MRWIGTPTDEHVRLMVENIRQQDAVEAVRYGYKTPAIAIEASMIESEKCYAVVLDDMPMALFGVIPFDVNSGWPWLVTSSLVEKHKRMFMSLSRMFVGRMICRYDHLAFAIDVDYERALRWARWCGFLLSEPTDLFNNGHMFVYAQMWRT